MSQTPPPLSATPLLPFTKTTLRDMDAVHALSPSCCSGVGLYQLVCIVTNSNPWARSSLDSGSGPTRKWMPKDLQRSIILNSPSLQVQTRPWCSGLSVSKRAHFIQPTAPFLSSGLLPSGYSALQFRISCHWQLWLAIINKVAPFLTNLELPKRVAEEASTQIKIGGGEIHVGSFILLEICLCLSCSVHADAKHRLSPP